MESASGNVGLNPLKAKLFECTNQIVACLITVNL